MPSDWKIGREPLPLELPADLVKTLLRKARRLGMETEEYASYVLSIQAVREELLRTLSVEAIGALEAIFGLLFCGMPQSRGGLERLERMLTTTLEYVNDNPHASLLELLDAIKASELN